jgi:hypothetical protein
VILKVEKLIRACCWTDLSLVGASLKKRYVRDRLEYQRAFDIRSLYSLIQQGHLGDKIRETRKSFMDYCSCRGYLFLSHSEWLYCAAEYTLLKNVIGRARFFEWKSQLVAIELFRIRFFISWCDKEHSITT